MSVDLAEWEDGVILRGALIGLLGEGVAQEASRDGRSTVVIWDEPNDTYLLSRFERASKSDRVEVSGYDIIEDTIGVAEAGLNVADWSDMNLDGELEWVLGRYPHHRLTWSHLTLHKA
ncbi:hypothetical protein [Roseibacillus ishigakijimensis]|uniref:Uncharacterized protein n=1 Tax=Roseibacillus ishigakijimensis TaxID=454146 RepID=A0A934VHH4_9BACT|nr:hypothetical protein [Roseibacillus ishigakijimensis]MBK1833958.1 hypothetical protein [Roseibacillus ishigakijimensis]